MSLDNLVRIGSLEVVARDPDRILRLLAAAERALADARIAGLGSETRFDTAYRALMQIASAALLSFGYRTPTHRPGHHATMIQNLHLTLGLAPEEVIVLDALRRQRHGIDYEGDLVSETMSDEAVRQAARPLQQARAKLSAPR